MNRTDLRLDAARRALTCRGKTTCLNEKTWQVLTQLLHAAPVSVTRDEIIERVWPGRPMTGEKGLNQAIWSLRGALGDDPRKPSFIRTIPRVGYRWIGPQPLDKRRSWPKVAGVAAAVMIALAVTSFDTAYVATQAYRVGIDVHVRFEGGEYGILKNARQVEIGDPILSIDGREVFVPVYERSGCRLVLVNLTTRQRQDFATCPAMSVPAEAES